MNNMDSDYYTDEEEEEPKTLTDEEVTEKEFDYAYNVLNEVKKDIDYNEKMEYPKNPILQKVALGDLLKLCLYDKLPNDLLKKWKRDN